MSDYQHKAWLRAIAAGIIVDVAAAGLLSLLINRVQRIDRRIVEVRDTLREAEANTADAALIPQVAAGVDAVLAEGLQHHLFLGRAVAQVKK